ncbi:Fc.00g007960.m01.CDS01 [Cosmosporella sp. VM-42]
MYLQPILTLLAATLPGIQACGLHVGSAFNENSLKRRTPVAEPATKKIVLKNVRVFDGHIFRGIDTVVIDGGVIGNNPHNADEIIDGKGRFLMPGLIESHNHVHSVSALEDLSSYGVTTALNMNCLNFTICNIMRSQVGLSSIFTAGVPVIAPEADHAKLVPLPSYMYITDPSQAEQFVAWAASNGSDFMKIVSEARGPSTDMQSAVVQASHRHGIPSTTHASWFVPFTQAVTSKTDSIQHTVGDSLIPLEWIAKIKKQGQFLTPTLTVHRYISTHEEARQALEGPGPTNQTYEIARENVRRLHKAGVPLLAGTDAVGSTGVFDLPWGITLHHELENLVEAGFTPAEALRAATSLPARLYHHTDRGVIAPGMRADLLLLNSNPLVNISNTQDISRVWIEGIEYKDVVKKA